MAGWPDDAENDALTSDEQRLHRQLLADGVDWRRGAKPLLPEVGAFVTRARQRLDRERASVSQAATASPLLTGVAQSTLSTDRPDPSRATQVSASPEQTVQATSARRAPPKGTYRVSTPIPVTPHPPRRRFAGLAGLAAALIVVALIAVVLSRALAARQNGPSHQGHHSIQTIGTPIPTATPGGSSSSSPISAAIAPSDPQIVYKTNAAETTIERSSNGGRTYTPVMTPPTTLQSAQFSVVISPLDANHVFATATGASACPVSNSQTTSRAP
ncbi:MAG TPA: hypothetical protein VKQ36_08195, partial [Ktedonobacterales bacterium]|nr:hypothetical protein [Ktedonobacterales bacterium]